MTEVDLTYAASLWAPACLLVLDCYPTQTMFSYNSLDLTLKHVAMLLMPEKTLLRLN